MYTLSKEYDLTRLQGAIVQQVCFAKNNISILLGNVGFITIEGRFTLFDDKGNEFRFEVYPVDKDFGLLNLLEQKIDKVVTNEERSDLIFTFDNEQVLVLIGDENYESYSIKVGNDEVRI